ncbi:MAG: 16S rRNA methyltransferase [Ktedonobacterales bacterium]
MKVGNDRQLDELVRAVVASSKYRQVSLDLIRSVGGQELAKRRNVKEAIKATKNKLHQVAAVYLPAATDYAGWLAELDTSAREGDGDMVRMVCRRILAQHASTRERLPILDQFYSETLAGLGSIHRILDIACGLNPLALPWMPLAEDAEYYAYDIYADMMAFVSGFFTLEPAQGCRRVYGHAAVLDVTRSVPEQQVDLALLLKAIPCLEQIEKESSARLLRDVRADHLLVSFPAYSLGGRTKGMLENYEARFYELISGTNWPVKRFQFATELAFLVSK